MSTGKHDLYKLASGRGSELISHGKNQKRVYTIVGCIILAVCFFTGIIVGIGAEGWIGFLIILAGGLLFLTCYAFGQFWEMLFGAFGELIINTEVTARSTLGEYDVSNIATAASAPAKSSDSSASVKPVTEMRSHSDPAPKVNVPAKPVYEKTKIHKCVNCGNMVNTNPCPKCGFVNSPERDSEENKDAPIKKLFKCPQCQKISQTIPCSNCGYEATEFL